MAMAVVVMVIGSGWRLKAVAHSLMQGQKLPLFIPEYREPNNGCDLHRIDRSAAGEAVGLSHTASAYAIGAAVAIIFNTVLAWLVRVAEHGHGAHVRSSLEPPAAWSSWPFSSWSAIACRVDTATC
jgi:hypothetical protein